MDTGDHTIFIGHVVAHSGGIDATRGGILNEHIAPLFRLGGTKFLSGDERIDVSRPEG
ncbi:MAG TPA: hypothetical protein VEB88_04265 [Candidatus Acidoferrales bacterium]|nr:hypothetical protein [Candidatus Acidoferrales bacterium]